MSRRNLNNVNLFYEIYLIAEKCLLIAWYMLADPLSVAWKKPHFSALLKPPYIGFSAPDTHPANEVQSIQLALSKPFL